jgi:hypothetical protein
MAIRMRKRDRDNPALLRKKVDTPLTKAIREEIKRLADEEKFTLGMLRAIERVAAHGRAMLSGTAELDALLGGGSGPLDLDDLEDDLLGGSSYIGGGISTSSTAENFGSRAMRELTAMLPKILEARNRTSTVELVRALAVARKEGLDEVAADLQEQIKGAKEDEPVPSVAKPLHELPRGAYWRPDDEALGTLAGRYIARGDPEWKIEEYNALTGDNAKATDFPRVIIEPPGAGEPEVRGAA